MFRTIQTTSDGSHTIAVPEMNVTYHSHHGAIGESMWVYTGAGFLDIINKRLPTVFSSNPGIEIREDDRQRPGLITILEIGFGTGLNALLTRREAFIYKQKVRYIAIEPFPLTARETAQLNHGKLLHDIEIFQRLHDTPWEEDVVIDPFFTLNKKKTTLQNFSPTEPFDCIYFDAFAPVDQPELWTEPGFKKLYSALNPGGRLVTYSSKSIIRKAMQSAGFHVTKIPGPYGKRDMVRAYKV